MGTVRHRWGATARARHGTPRCRHRAAETGRASAGVSVDGPRHQGGKVLFVVGMATDRREHEWGGGLSAVAVTTHARVVSPKPFQIIHALLKSLDLGTTSLGLCRHTSQPPEPSIHCASPNAIIS